MTNPNYVKGRKKEYKIKKELEMQGYTVLRTAGSHGFADLVAIKYPEIRFIQCKPDNFSKTAEEKKLMEENNIYNSMKYWKASFEVI